MKAGPALSNAIKGMVICGRFVRRLLRMIEGDTDADPYWLTAATAFISLIAFLAPHLPCPASLAACRSHPLAILKSQYTNYLSNR